MLFRSKKHKVNKRYFKESIPKPLTKTPSKNNITPRLGNIEILPKSRNTGKPLLNPSLMF